MRYELAMGDGTRAVLRGEKVWLRPIDSSDLDAYYEAVNDIDVAYWAYGRPQSRDQVDGWYETFVKAKQDSVFYAVSPIGSDELIGSVWIWNSDSRIAGLELSIFMTATHLGGGFGTDAMNAALDAAFTSTQVERIWLYTNADNVRAIRSFEKVGFVREGVLRHQTRMKGQWADALLMAILREEWEALDRPRSWDYEAAPLPR
jgi:RimJ/RimL family protein N-acetyltransferase